VKFIDAHGGRLGAFRATGGQAPHRVSRRGPRVKRDMDLIRQIALTLEDAPTGYVLDGISVEGYTDEEVGYHQYLMLEAGLGRGADTTVLGSTSPTALLTGLTWEGHEFAEAARADTLWAKAKRFIIDKGGPMTLAILQAVLKKLAAGSASSWTKPQARRECTRAERPSLCQRDAVKSDDIELAAGTSIAVDLELVLSESEQLRIDVYVGPVRLADVDPLEAPFGHGLAIHENAC
jgi:hypothetical protein